MTTATIEEKFTACSCAQSAGGKGKKAATGETGRAASIQPISRVVDGVVVEVLMGDGNCAPVSDDEIRAYIDRGNRQHPNSNVTGLALDVAGDEVGIRYELEPVPFDRIRRITGYLVGTMDRWNDAKTSEEHDRVKHGVLHAEAS